MVGVVGGLGAAGVDDHDLAAASAQRRGASGVVGHAPHRAVRDVRIGADHDEQVAAVDVGHRHAEHVAEEPSDGELLGHLVERCGGEDVRRPEGRGEVEHVQHHPGAMHRRVADEQPGRRGAVVVANGDQPAFDLVERLVEGDLDELAVALHERAP